MKIAISITLFVFILYVNNGVVLSKDLNIRENEKSIEEVKSVDDNNVDSKSDIEVPVVIAKGKRQSTYTGSPIVSNPTRISFPNFGDVSGSTPFIGFKAMPGTEIEETSILEDSFFGWNTNTNQIHIDVVGGSTIITHGHVNSFCDIPLPNSEDNFSPLGNVRPNINNAYTIRVPGQETTNAYFTFWVSEESFIDGGMLVITYQYFYGVDYSSNRRQITVSPTCYPTVQKISPGYAFIQGSVIFIEGQNFGIDADEISVKIGQNFQCIKVEMVVSDSVIRCVASGSGSVVGTPLSINMTVGSRSSVPPLKLISFRGDCPLICTSDSYPDQYCSNCVRPQSTTDDIGTSRLSQVVSSISSDLVEATYYSDLTFMQTAQYYKGNPVMEVLSVPRYTVPDVVVQMKFAVAATTPLKITALTNLLQGYDAGVIPSLELHYESQQAQWTKIDTNGTTTYRLDLI